MSIPEELGICATARNGFLYVWAYLDLTELTHVQVSIKNNLQKASGILDKKLCEKIYPGLWKEAEEKVLREMEVDDGL